jgi:hypothetical protein
MQFRRLALASFVLSTLAAVAACSASNGDAIPGTVFDASPLDAGSNMPYPDGGGADAAPGKDASKDAPLDAPGDGARTNDVLINEIYVDNYLLGDGAELVELRIPPGTPIDDLRLRLVDRTGAVKYDVAVADPGQVVGPGGIWVVGGSQTFKLNVNDHVDHVVDLNTWGLDNASGAVQVVRGTTLLDVVGYSTDADAGAIPPATTPPTATVEGRPAIVPADNGTKFAKRKSFGRRPGANSNDNRSDFCTMSATPGNENVCD